MSRPLFKHSSAYRFFISSGFWTTILTFLLLPCGHADSLPLLAEIVEPVTTEFGVYTPYPVEVVPAVAPYAPAVDLSNVANLGKFSFTEAEKALLVQNGFVVTPMLLIRGQYAVRAIPCGKMNELYKTGLPSFVTVDLMLHTFHELYERTLRTLEQECLLPDLNALTLRMLHASLDQRELKDTPLIAKAAQRNVAFFAVAAALLDPSFTVPVEVQTLVDGELMLIQNHSGRDESPLFGCMEDYSQYLPRGHYTRSEKLKRYFQAMMWYGRMMFRADALSPDPVLLTRQALLITRLMETESVIDEPARRVWERIYRPTVFFVGKSDDLTVHHYSELARDVFGEELENLPLDSLEDVGAIEHFTSQVSALPMPRINPDQGFGLRFMGQRFILDSYIFECLTDPDWRIFPRGLDVMAVLGSEKAERLLEEVYREADNPDYLSQMETMQNEFAAMEAKEWAQNLYCNWLYCLMPLLAEKGEGFPPYMQTEAWQDKELSSSLGSWAELRHDTILYGKQVKIPIGVEDVYPLSFALEYVEPNPWAFARIAALCRYARGGINHLELSSEKVEECLTRMESMESLSLLLKTVAEKQLENRPLTVEERRTIRTIGSDVDSLLSFYWEEPPDDDMSVIADVHTYSSTTLEAGVGRPLVLYVVVPDRDRLQIAVGAVFSYYEFMWPIDQVTLIDEWHIKDWEIEEWLSLPRLTDEFWQKILSEGPKIPPLQSWVRSYMDSANEPKPFKLEDPKYSRFGWAGRITGTVDPATPRKGDVVRIQAKVRVPSSPQTDDLQAEIIINGQLKTIPLLHDRMTSDADYYFLEIPTGDISAGAQITITVFSPSNLHVNYSTTFILGEEASVEEWTEF